MRTRANYFPVARDEEILSSDESNSDGSPQAAGKAPESAPRGTGAGASDISASAPRGTGADGSGAPATAPRGTRAGGSGRGPYFPARLVRDPDSERAREADTLTFYPKVRTLADELTKIDISVIGLVERGWSAAC